MEESFQGLEPYIEDFEVGDKVFSNAQPERSGKILDKWIDVLSRRLFLTIKWEDGITEFLPSDEVRKESKITFFSKEPKAPDERPGKVHSPEVELSFWKISSIFLDLARRIQTELGLRDYEVDNFLLNSKFFKRANNLVVRNNEYEILISDGNPIYGTFKIFKNGKQIGRGDFRNDISLRIEIRKIGDCYKVTIGEVDFEVDRDKLESFLDDYGISRDVLSILDKKEVWSCLV